MRDNYKRLLTIQDISCVGQCSLTVALPIISTCGIECCVLPSAVLSTHTYKFTGYTFRDLTDDIPVIAAHWNREGMKFDTVYTGYIGSHKQISYIKDLLASPCAADALKIIDPAMGDYGKLYPGFDEAYAKEMLTLCMQADIVVPNITEVCFMLDREYREEYDEDYVKSLCLLLQEKTGAKVVLTGISYSLETMGVAVFDGESFSYYEHHRLEPGSHGTGDVYSSAFAGALTRGIDIKAAARIAADFTVRCIEETHRHQGHWYGPVFEPELSTLAEAVKSEPASF